PFQTPPGPIPHRPRAPRQCARTSAANTGNDGTDDEAGPRRGLRPPGCCRGVGAGSAVAALLSGTVSPVVSVGNAVIDATPGAAKDWAVETFGENDKTVLLSSVFVVIGVLAAGAGAVGVTRRRTALGIATVLGLLALAAAFMDRTLFVDVWVAVLPAVVTLIVTVGVFALLLSALAGTAGAHTVEKAPPGFDRRRFLAV